MTLRLPPMLAEISVLDLSIWRPGPYATSLLVGLGADVLKVEPPGGDPMRHYPELFESVNAGKRSIELDLKDTSGRDGGRARALELAAVADVVVEGFRPGVVARLGLDEQSVRALNPDVVYCSISGYGQEGPLALVPGHDLNYQAWAGALAPDGGTATAPPLPLADLASGMAAAFGICAALVGRSASAGSGVYLDVSMTDVIATWTGTANSTSDQTHPAGEGEGRDRDETSSPTPSVPGYGLFDTVDGGQVALGVVNEQHFWSALCQQLGLAEFGAITFGERMQRGGELTGAVAAAIGSRRRDELVSDLMAAGVPAAPVLDRAGMTAAAPFPAFPIRLGNSLGGTLPSAPTLDQHHGQGFRRAG